ncbi:hypothetical protein ANN_27379 [Periplaneta americana]|uniref:Transposase Tc1-like domain-containing protein n=1 Tax=Periplaneta americana TaxID=6978 RepID=A0ABQ8RVL7_PERAM|nr:hypothetical protein ANN_27379 [Periplaneta americana]
MKTAKQATDAILLNLTTVACKLIRTRHIFTFSIIVGLTAAHTALIDTCRHSSMTQRQIAAECHIGLATVNSIIKRCRETGSITPQKKENCSRKRKTSPADDRLIVRKSKLNPRLTAVDLTHELMATNGANIHITTVRCRLLEAGRRARKPIKKQLLTPVICKKRLMWAKLHQHWTVNDWKNVLFSYESHFEVHGHRVSYVRKGYEKVSAPHLQQAPKYPLKWEKYKSEKRKRGQKGIWKRLWCDTNKYVQILEELSQEFDCRFEEFANLQSDISIFATTFSVNIDSVPSSLQLEVIDLQNDIEMKDRFENKKDLSTFYRRFPQARFPRLHRFAANIRIYVYTMDMELEDEDEDVDVEVGFRTLFSRQWIHAHRFTWKQLATLTKQKNDYAIN